jgi:hypothetical protein
LNLINEDIIEKALILCDEFENKTSSKTIFTHVHKEEFIKSLKKFILSQGELLFQSKNTCGVAAVIHVVAQSELLQLVKFAIHLYCEGVGEINAYKIQEKDRVEFWARYVKPTKGFNGVSLVLIGAIRFKENTSLGFEKGTMEGMTWPSEILNLLQNMLKLNVVNSMFLGWNVKQIRMLLKQKQQIILLYRTISWESKGKWFRNPWHYIVLKDICYMGNNIVNVKYWDHGAIKEQKLTKWQFYKGVLKTFVLSHF